MILLMRSLGVVVMGSIRRAVTLPAVFITCVLALAGPAAADSVFTIGNYPVDAEAKNAVAAKEKAIADGQRAAFRSLLKRIVPVTAYKQIERLKEVEAANLVSGFSVRSERNSSTRYIASLDFTFQADAVRSVLAQHAVPYVDRQADAITLIVASRAKPGDATQTDRGDWRTAWSGLDLANSVTPARLTDLKSEIHSDTISMLEAGDPSGLRIIANEYNSNRIVLAIAEVDRASKKLHVTLTGEDTVGPLLLKRAYSVSDGDFAYASELAAVVALGVLEGRWKAQIAPEGGSPGLFDPNSNQPAWAATSSGFGDPVQATAVFSGPAQWNDMRANLLQMPGLDGLEILSVSERNAQLSFRYPGGVNALVQAAATSGLNAVPTGQGLVLTPRP